MRIVLLASLAVMVGPPSPLGRLHSVITLLLPHDDITTSHAPRYFLQIEGCGGDCTNALCPVIKMLEGGVATGIIEGGFALQVAMDMV